MGMGTGTVDEPPPVERPVVFLYPKTRKDKYVQGRITGTDHKMQGNAE